MINNRNSANESELLVYPAITGGTTDGTLIASFRIGKETTIPVVGDAGAGNRSENEIIFKKNTKYLFRYTSHGDGNNINNLATWYEEDAV